MNIPASLIVSYSIFSIFLFYQQLHVKKFNGSSHLMGAVLGISGLTGTIFGIVFLLFWGYEVSWYQAVALFGIAFLIQSIWFLIEAKFGIRNLYGVFSLVGLVVLPVSGYFMWSELP
ncbi:hypothetical protein [Thalassospira sp. TSL5-1]|uniref:hypothetical protein n=1 Tax=Thalassospira sp. TSL5-1 TaxID=1544451 RepID=UPI00093A02B9|nr:hypothetical protein [Thalassospira sp. TSL5-1]OKH89055.1 hypothetical protein LF95_03065 [Thalassospira sp. TSL5-1]